MTPEQIEEIRARWKAARPGPWRWSGYRKAQQVDLMGPGGNEVMGFRRWGMNRAQPEFCTKGLLYSTYELTEGCDRNNPGRERITEIPHPDAAAIAAAPSDVADLLAEVDRLRGRLLALDTAARAACEDAERPDAKDREYQDENGERVVMVGWEHVVALRVALEAS